MDLAEVGVGNVGIDLSCGDVGVSEEGLDRAEVGAVHEEVGGERVAEGMRGNMFSDSGGASVFFDNTLDGAGGEAAEIAGGVDSVLISGVVEEEGGEGVGSGGEIFGDAVGGSFGDENGAVFLALTTDDKFATLEVDRIAIEVD